MKQSEKVAYLNKYTLSADKTVTFITDTTAIEKAPIPDYWKLAFSAKTLEERKGIILAEWEKHLSKELSNTILYLKKYLQNLELIKIGEDYSILYTLLTYKTKKEVFYEGKNPIRSSYLEIILHRGSDKINQTLVDFYTKLHDGFYYFASKSMGLESSNDIYSMSEEDWHFQEDLNDDLTDYYNFFSNGMGTYVVLDLNQRIESGAYLWSTHKLPKGNLNFWDVVDEWIVIGLDF